MKWYYENDWLYGLVDECFVWLIVVLLGKELNYLSFWLEIGNPSGWIEKWIVNVSLEKWEGENDMKSEKIPKKVEGEIDWNVIGQMRKYKNEKYEKRMNW